MGNDIHIAESQEQEQLIFRTFLALSRSGEVLTISASILRIDSLQRVYLQKLIVNSWYYIVPCQVLHHILQFSSSMKQGISELRSLVDMLLVPSYLLCKLAIVLPFP